MPLDGKVAIVTGAASGIGKEIALLSAREGARVTIADLNQEGADAVADELGGGKRAIGVEVNVTNEAQVDACAAKIVAAFGQVDILVSNAGRARLSNGAVRGRFADSGDVRQLP